MAGTITGGSGTLTNGQSCTLTGSSFGATGPTVVLFDDFESGTNGADISGNSPKVGNAWSTTGGRSSPIYTTGNARGGSSSKALRAWCGTTGTEDYQQIYGSYTGATTVYQSYWVLIPTGQNYPGQSISNINWKLSWIGSTGAWPDNDFTSIVYISSTQFAAGCDDPGDGPGQRFGYVDEGEFSPWPLSPGTWMRFSTYFRGATSGGAVRAFQTTGSGTSELTLGNPAPANTYTQDSGHNWTWITFPGYSRGETNTYIHHDDIYVATGSGALARVEIGNASTYATCTNLAVCTVTSWSASSIAFTVRSGSFSPTASVYLYVVDSNGDASAGYQATMGQSLGGGTPPTGTITLSVR